MAQAVVNDSAVNAGALKRAMARKHRDADLHAYSAEGVYVIDKAYTIPVTSFDDVGDEYHLLTFPPTCYLLSMRLKVTDGDSSTGLTFDIITDDGTTENKLIAASTVGQTGGNDELDANIDPAFFDVSSKNLAWQCAAAASGTATAITLTLRVVCMVGRQRLTTW